MEKVSDKKQFFTAKNISYLAVLVALVVVLQACSGFFKIGTTNLSFVLIPIVLGGMLLGTGTGALLGAIFGLVVIIDALAGLDAFTLLLLQKQPVFTVVLCFAKGIAAGVVPAIVYKALSKKNKYLAVILAAALAPICNTGIFILGGLIMSGTIGSLFANDMGVSVIYFLVIVCAGINFIIEFALNLVLSPALYTVESVVEKQIMKNAKKKKALNNSDDESEQKEV